MSMAGGRSGPPPLPDNYKNNILKAKTFDENKIAEATNIGIKHTNDRFHSPNLNLTGDSPPPKEVPDMSSATFVSVGGDKLTLSLGGCNNGTSGSLTTNTEKLINLDPITPSE